MNLLAFFRRHNDEFARMVGISRSRSSYYKYRCVYTHLAAFIRQRYQCEDLTFRELDRSFLVGFHAWIRKEPTLRTNTAWVYMTALKHILMLARGHGYIQRDCSSTTNCTANPLSATTSPRRSCSKSCTYRWTNPNCNSYATLMSSAVSPAFPTSMSASCIPSTSDTNATSSG